MPLLKIIQADGAVSSVDLHRTRRYGIGRSDENAVVLSDPLVSRNHAEIYHDGSDWCVRDCGSSNGTFVDDLPVGGSMSLRVGSTIALGDCRLRLKVSGDPRELVSLDDTPISPTGTIMLSAEELITSSGRVAPAEPGTEDVDVLRRRLHAVEQANLKLLAHVPIEDLLPRVVDLVFDAVRPDLAALLCVDPGGELVCRAFRSEGDREASISRTIARTVMDDRASILTADAQSDPRFAAGQSVLGVRAAMAAPLWDNEDVVGLVYAESRMDTEQFDEDDLKLLTMLGNVAAIQIRNATLFEEQLTKQRFEREVKAAADIQRRLLPSAPPTIPGYAFEADSLPCYEVGGDYYDFRVGPEGMHRLVLADVAGKGMGAALLMAGLQASFQARAAIAPDLTGLAGSLNEAVHRTSPADRFVTMFLLELDHTTHDVRWLNAGHAPSPVVVRASGSVEPLPSGGIPAGIQSDVRYPTAEFGLEPGDLVFACSDGVTDLVDGGGERFGEDRLHQVLAASAGSAPAEVRENLERALEAYRDGASAPDDITFMILGRGAG
jgi:sigma-B regulation protein RsbU (phosphoserine phosphatase)